MSALPTPYRVAFQEASKHYDDFPDLLEGIALLEARIAERKVASEEHAS